MGIVRGVKVEWWNNGEVIFLIHNNVEICATTNESGNNVSFRQHVSCYFVNRRNGEVQRVEGGCASCNDGRQQATPLKKCRQSAGRTYRRRERETAATKWSAQERQMESSTNNLCTDATVRQTCTKVSELDELGKSTPLEPVSTKPRATVSRSDPVELHG